MPTYRMNELGQDGRVLIGSDLECATDEVAFRWAAIVSEAGVKVEIWHGDRFVGRLPENVVLRPWARVIFNTPATESVSAGQRFLAWAESQLAE